MIDKKVAQEITESVNSADCVDVLCVTVHGRGVLHRWAWGGNRIIMRGAIEELRDVLRDSAHERELEIDVRDMEEKND